MTDSGGNVDHGREPLLSRLETLFPEASRRSLKQWLDQGRVVVNGTVDRDPRTVLGANDDVKLAHRRRAFFPEPLTLIHEDDHILVLEKPAGLLTVATEREREHTAYRLVWDYLHAADPPRRPFIVHRLDRDTSGLLVVAKSPDVKRHLQAQFKAGSAKRIYLAVVQGAVTPDDGKLESRLFQDRSLKVRSGRRGKEAVTIFKVLKRSRSSSLLELSLETGRRRQIRAQLAGIGHPVLGDREYGATRDPWGRLALHATELAFDHPVTARRARFRSAAPRPFNSPP